MDQLAIKNWERWQSYRSDRCQPPWIKLHRCLMRNHDWVSLSDAQRGQLVSIWLLAADKKGMIPKDPEVIKKLCFMDSTPDINLFIEHGFIEIDANMTSERRQDDAEVTQQTRLDKTRLDKKEHGADPNGSTHASSLHFEQFWEHWPVKRNKKKAKAVFIRKKFEIADVDELIKDVTRRTKNDEQWKKGFIPHCSTYLNGDRWEDDYGN